MLDRPNLAALFAKHVQSQTLDTVQKDQPSVADVHVPSPNWKPGRAPAKRPKKTALERRKMLAALIQKLGSGDDPGTYVGRMVENADQLREWWQSVRGEGEPDALDANTHCTVLYSRATVNIPADASRVVIDPAQCRFGMLGAAHAKSAVVLFLDAPVLVARNDAYHAAGGVEDYPEHRPHVTLFYLGAGYDSTQWRDGNMPDVPPFPIILGPELVGTLSVDVFEVVKAPGWYVPQARG